jgi:hypothetical protein
MTLTELAERIGMALANRSILKTGKARDPLLDARGHLRGARVPARRHSQFSDGARARTTAGDQQAERKPMNGPDLTQRAFP